MKIGILTFHRAHNYGAVLQCYALQEVLKGMGHDVEVIDYRQPWIESFYKPFSIKYSCRRLHSIRSVLGYVCGYPHRKKVTDKKKLIFESFSQKYLNISKEKYDPDIIGKYDCFVIGSDQLWSLNCIGDRFDKIYFGNIKKKKTAIIMGYAISSNESSIKQVPLEIIRNFEFLSLREAEYSEYLSKLTTKKIETCVDPTLLLCKDQWNKLCKENENGDYIAVYQVRSPQGRNVIISKASNLARKYGYNVIDINEINPSVDDFVSIIRNARCVLTSSFHATVFSIIFKTPFYSFLLNDGKDARYENLLRLMKMEDNMIDVSENVETIPCMEYNLEENLIIITQASRRFLEQLEKIKVN